MTWCRRPPCFCFPYWSSSPSPSDLVRCQTTAAVRFPPPDVAERNDILLDNRVPIRMRDGVSLYADVFRPVGNERYPVIVSRTPYSTERFPSAYEAGVYFRAAATCTCSRTSGGATNRTGRWEPFFDDERDGYTPSSGRPAAVVQRQGGNAGGCTGQSVARGPGRPPSLVTIFPSVASTSIYHDWITLERRLAAVVQLRLFGVRQSRASCRTRALTPSTVCTRSTTTRCSGTCR